MQSHLLARNYFVMIRFILITLCVSTIGVVFAQESETFIHNRFVLERIGSQGAMSAGVPMAAMPGAPPGLLGDVYLNLDYRNATFILYDGDKVTKQYASRLDLQRNEFEIKLPNGLRSLSGTLVKSLVWTDSVSRTPQYFVNGREFIDRDSAAYLGFFQILTEGDLTLLKMTMLVFKPADKNLAQSVGPKDNKFIKNPKFFYAIGRKALKLPGKKGVRELFASRKDEMEKFIKENEINLGKEDHVMAAFIHYNSLVKR